LRQGKGWFRHGLKWNDCYDLDIYPQILNKFCLNNIKIACREVELSDFPRRIPPAIISK
jgi:hypothetical protein